jgi:hypothetical protein
MLFQTVPSLGLELIVINDLIYEYFLVTEHT